MVPAADAKRSSKIRVNDAWRLLSPEPLAVCCICSRAALRIFGMRPEPFPIRPHIFFAPEYGGEAVTGGGHPADSVVPAREEVDDALGQDERGYGNTPGVGVPGSRNNPVTPLHDDISRRARRYWEEEGQPEGRAEEHWRRAEEDLRNERSQSAANE